MQDEKKAFRNRLSCLCYGVPLSVVDRKSHIEDDSSSIGTRGSKMHVEMKAHRNRLSCLCYGVPLSVVHRKAAVAEHPPGSGPFAASWQ